LENRFPVGIKFKRYSSLGESSFVFAASQNMIFILVRFGNSIENANDSGIFLGDKRASESVLLGNSTVDLLRTLLNELKALTQILS
jgi:hypothetical protein